MKQTLTMTSAELDILRKAAVYIIWKQSPDDKEALYVGKSSSVGRRLFNPHRVLSKIDDAISVEIVPCEDGESALATLESETIRRLMPRLNSNYPGADKKTCSMRLTKEAIRILDEEAQECGMGRGMTIELLLDEIYQLRLAGRIGGY